MINQTPGVTPPRAFGYVNPNAGYQGQQYGLTNYQNQMAYSQLQGQGGGNPWMSALSGAGQGAMAGSQVYPGWGTAIGAGVGAVGGYLSDERLKNNISRTQSLTRDGIPIVEFDMAGRHYRGVLAQDVLKVKPEAVGIWNGFYTVRYDLLGIKMQEVQ
jgi:hypothetical protein